MDSAKTVELDVEEKKLTLKSEIPERLLCVYYEGRCGRLPWHQAGNLRVRGSNYCGSKATFDPGLAKK